MSEVTRILTAIEQGNAKSTDELLATAKRWWAYARAWLFHEMNSPPAGFI